MSLVSRVQSRPISAAGTGAGSRFRGLGSRCQEPLAPSNMPHKRKRSSLQTSLFSACFTRSAACQLEFVVFSVPHSKKIVIVILIQIIVIVIVTAITVVISVQAERKIRIVECISRMANIRNSSGIGSAFTTTASLSLAAG